MTTRWAYFNGDWIDDRTLSVPVDDLGFTLGVTATERLRTFGGAPFRVAEHLQRMRRSCEVIGLDADSLVGELGDAIEEFLRRNASLFVEGDDWSIAAWVTPGSGNGPTRCVHGFALRFADWAPQFDAGVSLHVSQHRQTPANCWPPELKCRSRMHYYLADMEAQTIEAGARALLLDQDGFVGEASTANVVAYFAQEGIVSPRLDKVLPGVSVAVVRELAAKLDLPFVERDLTVEELHASDEAWFCSTSVCLLPVVRCDHQPIGPGVPGPMYKRLLAAWSDLVGIDIAAQAQRFASR